MKSLNVLSLFDGISCCQLALNKAGIKINKYYASEIETKAIDITMNNFPTTIQLGNVIDLDARSLKIDLLAGGSPCQDLSKAKSLDNKGLKGDKSSLFWEYVRILNETNPKYFLFENVVPKNKADRDIITASLGVEPILINSDLFVCQNRPRLYWTNIPIKELPLRPNWNRQYYQWRRNHWRELKNGVSPCLTANMGTGGNNVPYILENEEKRVLTINELEELQGLPNDYTAGVAATHRKKAIGNGWTVDVIAHIFKGIGD